jgi:hypothetical protein
MQDELEKELEELEQEDLDRTLLNPAPAVSLPTPPSAEPEMPAAAHAAAAGRQSEF